MSRHVIKMPDIGEGIAEVEIVEWHVAVGDSVVEDQVLADVMTDKASVEIPSPITGTVISLGGQVGDILAVGKELVVLEPATDKEASTTGDVAQPRPVTPEGTAHAQSSEADLSSGQEHVDASSESPPLSEARTPDHLAKAQEQARPALLGATSIHSKKALASPSVRRRARQLDIDLQELAGEGRDAHVTHADLDQYLLAGQQSSKSSRLQPSIPANATPQDAIASSGHRDSHGTETTDVREPVDTQVKVVGLRRQIARKMQESKRHIPHFSYVEEVDVTELERLRSALNEEQHNGQERLTVLPFLVRAIVLAVAHHPEVNARYDDENGVITRFGAVHLGVATQTEGGLMVPVMRNAEKLDLWDCATEIKRLAAAARRGKLRREELAGSSLTLSSLGPLGELFPHP